MPEYAFATIFLDPRNPHNDRVEVNGRILRDVQAIKIEDKFNDARVATIRISRVEVHEA